MTHKFPILFSVYFTLINVTECQPMRERRKRRKKTTLKLCHYQLSLFKSNSNAYINVERPFFFQHVMWKPVQPPRIDENQMHMGIHTYSSYEYNIRTLRAKKNNLILHTNYLFGIHCWLMCLCWLNEPMAKKKFAFLFY
jgi:hypothetical protein